MFDGWSLEYEMLFYLFLSLGLFFSRKYLTYVVSIIAITFAVRFFDLDSVAYEFIFGVLLGIIYTNFGNNYLLQICSLVLGVALFFSTLVGNPIILAEGSRALIFGAPAFLLIYGLIGLTQIKAGVLTVLGDASYSIYLIQVFTIPAFYKVASSFEAFSHFSSDLLALLCLIFTALGGVITYFLLERNFANVFSKRIK